jgi:hypothetical protein
MSGKIFNKAQLQAALAKGKAAVGKGNSAKAVVVTARQLWYLMKIGLFPEAIELKVRPASCSVHALVQCMV